MKTSKHHGQIMGETSSRSKISTNIGCARAKAPTKKTGGCLGKSKGQSCTSLVGKDGKILQSALGQTISKQLPIEGACPLQSEDLTPKLELKETLRHTPKIKIQFFPIDEVTRNGLEKDGHNPHLELILSDRKKIASVLKHLQSKWGGSSVAVGELMLLPYNIRPENLGGCMKWTLEDGVTCAADVYAAIGRPSIFRLRYGWLSNMESKSCTPLASSCLEEDCSEYENLKKDCSMNVEVKHGEKQPCELDGHHTPILLGDAPNTVDEPQNTLRIGDGLSLSSSLWTDGLTNICIGGLLPEASLNAASGCADGPTRNESQFPFSCDSFDAAIAAHIYGCRGLQQPSQNSICSLLDAEETCHPFPFQKSCLSRQDVLASSKSAVSTSSQDVSSTSFKFPNLVEVNNHTGIPQDDESQEQKADFPPCTHETGASSNLGTSDINWQSDSLGPLDLGLSSCRQLISGDSISIGGLLTSSLDAFQNCSLFGRDGEVIP